MSARMLWTVAVAALLAAPGTVSAQEVIDTMKADGWINIEPMPPDTMGFYGGVVNRAKFTTPGADCDAVEVVFDELAKALWLSGNDSTTPGRYAAYYAIRVQTSETDTTTSVIAGLVIDRPTMGLGHAFALQMLLHEAAHHAGYTHTGPFNAYTAESCAVLGPPLEEEEDDDEPTCGDGADCGGGDPTSDPTPEPVCKEVQVTENYTDYELQVLTGEVCFPWDRVGANFCANIARKEWVEVQKVRVVTKTVCEN